MIVSEIVEALKRTLDDKNTALIIEGLRAHKNNRIWTCGNGGSASTALHFASDLRTLNFDVVCMNENISRITAIVNDYSWDSVYIRQMQHFAKEDVLVVISVHGGTIRNQEQIPVSGKLVWSSNLVLACQHAHEKKGLVLALLGGDGGLIKKTADISIIVPHEATYVVEGIHSVLCHLICERLK
jgi:D-sedoheptulose 7-phosphate isomerase